MLNIWIQPSGYTLPGISGLTGDLTLDKARTTFDSGTTSLDKGTFQERVIVNIPLPIDRTLAGGSPVEVRTYDGTGNHPNFPGRNAAGSTFERYGPPNYTDGVWAMRTDLPNPRYISNVVVAGHGEDPAPEGYSGMMYAWGQFLTHDLSFERGDNKVDISVQIPANDTALTPGSFIPVFRIAKSPGTGRNGIVAEFINDVTGWLDASVVYGIAYPPGLPQGPTAFANPVSLREGGQIATTGKLLTTSNGKYGPIVDGNFLYGDPRGVENPDLSSLQTLFIREHNWHVDRLKIIHPTWTGEQLYQAARAMVQAEEQVITYKEWLPKLLGPNALPQYFGFKEELDATIRVEFAVAALRFGHSIVSNALDRIDEQGNVTASLTLAQAFFLTPEQFEANGGADGFLRKLAADISNALDVHIVDDLRNLLDDPPAAMDLAATNIQRGRDLGIGSLNATRIIFGLAPYTSFDQITKDKVTADSLKTAYQNKIDNVDLWVGGLAEDHYPNAFCGQTFRTIMIDQFTKLRDGDRLYWENQGWPALDYQWIRDTTLADIILRNTDTVRIQPDVFVAVEREDLYNGNVAPASPRPMFATTTPTIVPAPVFRIISGSLPPGLRIEGSYIVGVPYGVVRTTTFTFCVRAQLGTEISDRTFNIIVNGGQLPEIVTPAGLLPVGRHGQKFALGKTLVNYQLQAFDPDGEALTYFIAAGDGNLPPGLSLSPSGILSGIVEPVQAVALQTSGNGTYDDVFYDTTYYDFGIRSSNGYDSYIYDTVDFDYSSPAKAPRALNQTYEFLVSVSTGDVSVKRKFSIFVIGDDSFYADYTQLTNDSDIFTADVTFLQEPIWLTSGNLGTCRADNYVTYQLEVLEIVDAYPIVFTLGATDSWKTNTVYRADDAVTYNTRTYICITAHRSGITFIANNGFTVYWRLAELPPGLTFNPVDNKVFIAGRIPFQPAVAKSYSFSIIATRAGGDIQPVVARRTFNLRVIGDIDNTIKWNTDYNLGSIPANFVSDLQVSASTVLSSSLIYSITAGNLPPGLELTSYGEIVGKVNQYGTPNISRITTLDDSGLTLDAKFTTIDANHQYDLLGTKGLILFDSSNVNFTIDGGATTFDRTYKFTVYVKDQYGLSDSTKDFVLTVTTPNKKLYSGIKVQPLLNLTQRTNFRKFISDTNIFTTSSIFRPGDPNFGVRKDLAMLIYAGIETSNAAKYLGAMGLNHKRKRFLIGNVAKASAIKNKTTIYEVVYLEIYDPLEPAGQQPNEFIINNARDQLKLTSDISGAIWASPTDTETLNVAESWLDRPISNVTIDSTAYNISDDAPKKHYISSVSNWRKSLATVGDTERNYLPLWMRSIQPGAKLELGFKLAVPLCYCLPGTADDIILNIKYSGFDFKTLDYTADRYIIDSITGQSSDKYLVFNNHTTTV